MIKINGSVAVRSPPIPTSENHSYVNLNQAQTGSRKPSYQDSSFASVVSGTKRPIVSPRPINRGSVDINVHAESPYMSNPEIPNNWYSPPSSVHSNSRPPSIVGPSNIHMKKNAKANPNSSRPMSMASSIYPNTMQRLHTIDEDSSVLSIDKLLDLCSYDDEDVRANAFRYLQHLTFNNPHNKMQVRDYQGLPIIIGEIDSDNNYVARSALALLKNMSFSDVEVITTDIENLGAIKKLVEIIYSTEDITQKELALDIIWNLSVKYNLKSTILTNVIPMLINSIVIPDSGMVRQDAGNYVEGDEDIAWSTMLRNCLGIIRNVSYESSEARTILRNVDGLVDCILYVIFKSGNTGEEEEERDIHIALIDTKIVENCVCILRNLTYAIQEVVDPDYLEKRRTNNQKTKTSYKTKTNEDQANMIAPPPSSGVQKGYELLWNSKYIVTALFPIMKNGANAVTLEAAAGVIQNLTAGDWGPSKEMQIQFRLQLALPTLIELVDFGTNEVIRSAATALRNLVQENFCCMLIGKNGLRNLTEKIPMSSRSKKIEATALAALLSTIFVIISDQVEFMKDFIAIKGANRCIYVRDIDEFNIPDDTYPDKVKTFCQCILDLLWKTSATHEMLKKNNIKQSDIYASHNKSGNISKASINNNNRESNDMRSHDSIVSDENDRGAQYPKDERYVRDSISEIVSNSGLKDRNSAAYTTNSINGYGEVRCPANSKANRHAPLDTIQSRVSSMSPSTKKDNYYRAHGTYPASPTANNRRVISHGAVSPRTISPLPVIPREMPPINGRVSADMRKHSANPRASRDIRDINIQLHNRTSDNDNISKDIDYKYARPMKPRLNQDNDSTHKYKDSGL